jgi:hypothetical protein
MAYEEMIDETVAMAEAQALADMGAEDFEDDGDFEPFDVEYPADLEY